MPTARQVRQISAVGVLLAAGAMSLYAIAASPRANPGDQMLVIRLEARGGAFSPARLDVPAGRKFKIEITNNSDEPVEFESTDLRKEKVLAPGASSFVVVFPLKPGGYEFFDDFKRDTARGTIVVN